MTESIATNPEVRIGLALSGGGIRAAVFHLGVLRHLAESGLLEQVSQISTVSGGSLITGAIYCHNAGRWPTSKEFLERLYPDLRRLLTSADLFSFQALGLVGLVSQNVRVLFRRASILEGLLRNRWGILLKMTELSPSPRWHINTTSYETGKNWRFSQDAMGDWKFGTLYGPDVSIASAIAASAAVPYVIGALRLKIPSDGWWRTDPATRQPLERIHPALRTVRLWDGGAYENMALEPLYKPVGGLSGCDLLICSDASGPLRPPSSLLRTMMDGGLPSPRLFDIASDQIRSLRSRMLVKAIRQKEINGFLLRMGTTARQFSKLPGKIPGVLSDADCETCLNYPTNLTAIAPENFDLLSRHGSEVARLTMVTYVSS